MTERQRKDAWQLCPYAMKELEALEAAVLRLQTQLTAQGRDTSVARQQVHTLAVQLTELKTENGRQQAFLCLGPEVAG